MLVLNVILNEHEKALDSFSWLSLSGIMVFDLLRGYSLKLKGLKIASIRVRRFALGVCFGRAAFAAVSSYRIFGLCLMSVLDVAFGGGFVLSFRWFALGAGKRRKKEIRNRRLSQ